MTDSLGYRISDHLYIVTNRITADNRYAHRQKLSAQISFVGVETLPCQEFIANAYNTRLFQFCLISDVESEVYNVAIMNDVGFSFEFYFSGGFAFFFAAEFS